MSGDVIEMLRQRLSSELAVLDEARKNVSELRAAIEAIEASRSSSTQAPRSPRPKRRQRGETTRFVLDCIREGKGTVQKIVAEAAERCVSDLSANSVSNAIYRLQQKKQISWDVDAKCYVLWRSERVVLLEALTESIKAEGSKDRSLEPSLKNGAVGHYPT